MKSGEVADFTIFGLGVLDVFLGACLSDVFAFDEDVAIDATEVIIVAAEVSFGVGALLSTVTRFFCLCYC